MLPCVLISLVNIFSFQFEELLSPVCVRQVSSSGKPQLAFVCLGKAISREG